MSKGPPSAPVAFWPEPPSYAAGELRAPPPFPLMAWTFRYSARRGVVAAPGHAAGRDPPIDQIGRELRERNRAVVAQFVELLDALLADPDANAIEPRVKIDHIRAHLEAIMQLIGKARSHRAREEFIAALRDDVDRRELAVYEMRSARLRTEILVKDRQHGTADAAVVADEEHPVAGRGISELNRTSNFSPAGCIRQRTGPCPWPTRRHFEWAFLCSLAHCHAETPESDD